MIRRLFVSSSLRWGTRSIQSAADAAKEVSYARALFFGVNNEHQCVSFAELLFGFC